MSEKASLTYRGFFLTLEGGDGAGKSTLITGLCSWLKSLFIPVLTTCEPGGCALGDTIRQLALSTGSALDARAELALFLAARAQHVTEKILPALQEGKFVICDRFHDSTIAYQGYGRKLGAQYVEDLSHFFAHGLVPDCTLYCNVDPKSALLRIKRSKHRVLDRLEQESAEYHERVYEGFCALAKANPERIHTLNAAEAPQKVRSNAINILQPLLNTWQQATHEKNRNT